MPGVELPVPGEAKASDISTYCRRLADLIDSGEVPIDGALFLLRSGPSIHIQSVGLSTLESMGMLGFAARMT